jgi:hypothetical protein
VHKVNVKGLEELLKEEEEARRLREESADWEYIERLPPRVRAAVKLYIKTGDLRLAQKVSGLPLEEFVDVLGRARVLI